MPARKKEDTRALFFRCPSELIKTLLFFFCVFYTLRCWKPAEFDWNIVQRKIPADLGTLYHYIYVQSPLVHLIPYIQAFLYTSVGRCLEPLSAFNTYYPICHRGHLARERRRVSNLRPRGSNFAMSLRLTQPLCRIRHSMDPGLSTWTSMLGRQKPYSNIKTCSWPIPPCSNRCTSLRHIKHSPRSTHNWLRHQQLLPPPFHHHHRHHHLPHSPPSTPVTSSFPNPPPAYSPSTPHPTNLPHRTPSTAPTPTTWKPDNQHYDSNPLHGHPLFRQIQPTAWSRARNVHGMDPLLLPASFLLRQGQEEFALRLLSAGRYMGLIPTRNIAESVLMSMLLKNMREKNLFIDDLANLFMNRLANPYHRRRTKP